VKDKKQLLWDLSIQAAELSVEINELKKLTTTAINCCPNLKWEGGFLLGTPHFHEWFEDAKEQHCRVDDLEDFGECHYCLDAYQKVQERKKLQVQRGYLRSRITRLVRGAA
jgi:hypothetical protein